MVSGANLARQVDKIKREYGTLTSLWNFQLLFDKNYQLFLKTYAVLLRNIL